MHLWVPHLCVCCNGEDVRDAVSLQAPVHQAGLEPCDKHQQVANVR